MRSSTSICRLYSPPAIATELTNDCVAGRRVAVSVALERALEVLNRDLSRVEHVNDRAWGRACAATVSTAQSASHVRLSHVGLPDQ